MKFEVYSDVHASSIAPRGEMYFSHSFVKVQDYSAYLRREGAEFSVCLGDICEYTGNAEIDDPGHPGGQPVFQLRAGRLEIRRSRHKL